MSTATAAGELTTILKELRATRARAVQSLEELRRAEQDSRHRLAGAQEHDHVKRLTGASSLERAIASTERVVTAADRQIAEVSARLADEAGAGWLGARP